MKLLVSMGVKRGAQASEPLRARLVELDADAGRVLRSFDWDSSPRVMSSARADQEFTSAAPWDDDLLLQPTHNEVLWFSTRRWEVVRHITHPLLHSVHSAVRSPGGGFTVTSAGLQSVLCFDAAGHLEEHHYLPDGAFWDDHCGIDDFRRCHHGAFKPHSHHPNAAFYSDGRLWVTCFEARWCQTVGAPARTVHFDGIPHDGRLRNGLLWFTLIDGRVVAVDPVTGQRRMELDLKRLLGTRRMLGWCRGIEVVGSRLFVGMTMLRQTNHREVLRWLVKGEAGRKLPTRVIEVDLDGPRVVRSATLGNRTGGTIYGINAPMGPSIRTA